MQHKIQKWASNPKKIMKNLSKLVKNQFSKPIFYQNQFSRIDLNQSKSISNFEKIGILTIYGDSVSWKLFFSKGVFRCLKNGTYFLGHSWCLVTNFRILYRQLRFERYFQRTKVFTHWTILEISNDFWLSMSLPGTSVLFSVITHSAQKF